MSDSREFLATKTIWKRPCASACLRVRDLVRTGSRGPFFSCAYETECVRRPVYWAEWVCSGPLWRMPRPKLTLRGSKDSCDVVIQLGYSDRLHLNILGASHYPDVRLCPVCRHSDALRPLLECAGKRSLLVDRRPQRRLYRRSAGPSICLQSRGAGTVGVHCSAEANGTMAWLGNRCGPLNLNVVPSRESLAGISGTNQDDVASFQMLHLRFSRSCSDPAPQVSTCASVPAQIPAADYRVCHRPDGGCRPANMDAVSVRPGCRAFGRRNWRSILSRWDNLGLRIQRQGSPILACGGWNTKIWEHSPY